MLCLVDWTATATSACFMHRQMRVPLRILRGDTTSLCWSYRMSPVPNPSIAFIATAVSRAVTTTLMLAVAACSTAEKRADSTSAATTTSSMPAAMPSDTGKAGMHGMAGMTGDPDHDFLRMMSDHHKGLIVLAHMTKDRKEGGVAVADAKKLDAKQDAELDQMMTALEKHYKDPYAPKVMAEHQAMADELKTKSGTEYDRTFLQDVIKHHEGALKLIDDYVPKATKPMLKTMAEQMKVDQTREIAQMKAQLAKLGT